MEILICDDGSQDETPQIAARLESERPAVRALIAEKNLGKGAAVRMGIDGSKGDIVLIQDADLEYDPVDIPGLIAPLVEGRADAVYGSRLRGGEPQRRTSSGTTSATASCRWSPTCSSTRRSVTWRSATRRSAAI